MKRDRIETLKANAKLDVRLPDQLKDAFLARCRDEGVSSGAVIRSLIVDYLTASSRRRPAMAASVKETVMKRAKWIAGAIGGAGLAGMGTVALVLAPAANAGDVDLDFLLTLETADGSEYSWSWDHPALFDEAAVLMPEEFAGSRYGLRVTVSPCRVDSERLARDCDVFLRLAVLELDVERGPDNTPLITDQVVVAEPMLAGRFGAPMEARLISNDGEFSYVLTARVDEPADTASP